MADIIEKQVVKLFSDSESTGEQSVLIDKTDECGPWMIVSHNGEEFSLSVENWNKLVVLAETAKAKI